MYAEKSLLYLASQKTNWAPASYNQQYITHIAVIYKQETKIA
jgi:hypothetical protein